MFKKLIPYSLFLLIYLINACAPYKQNIMFKTDGKNLEGLKATINQVDKNYVIQKNDFLDIQIYTNNGERLIDPNQEFEIGSNQITNNEIIRPKYLVQVSGFVRLPMVNLIKLEGFTLNQADSILQKAYSEFYKGVFVFTKYLNKRVFVLGAVGGSVGGGSSMGGGGRVVPLENEDMNLIEVLAIVGGVSKESKVNNIRLIRGDLKEPYVELIDLSTIEGMKRATLKLEPNDIIYVEPIRRPFLEAFRDYSSLFSFFTGLGSLTLSTVLLIRTLNSN